MEKSLGSCQIDLLKAIVEEGKGLVQEIVHSFVLITPPRKWGYGIVHGNIVLNCGQVEETQVNSQMEVIVVGLEKLEGGKFPYFVGLSIEEWGENSNFIFFVPEGYCNTDPPLIPLIFVGFDEDGIGGL